VTEHFQNGEKSMFLERVLLNPSILAQL